MTDLTPEHIVTELNRYIIGQDDAKRSVAVALRNRWRRSRVAEPMREEIVPKNILMIGPTGVGKTEIARRIAKLSGSPFIKVEATKFTEVGYVGRDVDSIIRDLVENAVNMLKEQSHKEVKEKAYDLAQERVLDALVGESASSDTREKFRQKLQKSELDDKEIEIDVQDNPSGSNMLDIPGMPGSQMGVINIGDMLGKAMGGRVKTKRMTVAESYDILVAEESEKLIDEEQIIRDALKKVEQEGIVFIDEIDKVAARSDAKGGEVSREGVQRDLLPLIEGTTVSTKYGALQTDHILFIASGAFHMAKPSDLLPELQGRLPIRVVLNALTQDDMVRILKEPESSLLKQYEALMGVEEVTLTFTDKGIDHIAKIATQVNKNVENIGARRLHTILERLLEDISFNATNRTGETITIDEKYVDENLGDMSQNTDLSRFIL